jgi:ribose transport system ATP-binding protein
VASLPIGGTSAKAIAGLMIERDLTEMFPKRRVDLGEAILNIRGLSAPNRFDDVSFSLRRGEVLGITGLLGSGAKDLIRTLFGLEQAASGQIEIEGRAVRPGSPAKAVDRRLALVPEDRRGHGVGLDLSVTENITLPSLARYSRFGFLNRKRERSDTEDLIKRLQIKTAGRDALVRTLSGGNQQKVAIAKQLAVDPKVILMDEPTRGIDVGAKSEIHRLLRELAGAGIGILVISSELPELIGLCDRVLVVREGRIAGEVSGNEMTEEAIMRLASGIGSASETNLKASGHVA